MVKQKKGADKPWFQSYPKGVLTELAVSSETNLATFFSKTCEKFSDHISFHCLGQDLSFGQLETLTDHFAAYLQEELGLVKGDRVAIMLPNILNYPVVLFACLRAGLVVVNANPLYTPHELKHQLKDSSAKAIIVLENFAHVVAEVIDETALKHVVVGSVSDFMPWPKSWLVRCYMKITGKIPSYSFPACNRFKRALCIGQKLKFDAPKIESEDLAFLQYTGGTTGRAKGAMLSHGNVLANVMQVDAWIGDHLEPGKETALAALPMYHIFCLVVNVFCFFSQGATNVLIPNPRNVKNLVKSFQKWHFSLVTGVNTLFNVLLMEPGFKVVNHKAFKFVIGGGAAVKKAVAQEWQEQTGHLILEGYGLTECSPVVSVNPPDLKVFNGSVGLPLPSTDLRFCDDDGNDVPLGEPGELWVKGPQVMQGYWKNKVDTKSAIADGWLKTGDIATLDAAGFTRIVDRKKDLILVSGFNVYPNEVEDVIMLHPYVDDVACIGVDDSRSGEAVKAVVVAKSQGLTVDDIQQHCRHYLTAYKVPDFVEFCDALPKSSVGKVLRKDLK